jgi:hypothetical protein
MATLSVSAGTARARRAVIRHFTEHAATTPERAVGFEPAGRTEGRLFLQMRAAGAIREAAPGRFYVDAGRLAAFRAGVRRRVVRVAMMTGVLAASVVAIVT